MTGSSPKAGHSIHTATPGFINAPVGLFRVDQATIPYSNQESIPNVLFRSGELVCGAFGVSQGTVAGELRMAVTEAVDKFAEERLASLPSEGWDVYKKARDDGRAYV